MSENPEFVADLRALGLPADFMDHEATEAYIADFIENKAWVLDAFSGES